MLQIEISSVLCSFIVAVPHAHVFNVSAVRYILVLCKCLSDMFMFYEVLHSDFTMSDATSKYIKKIFPVIFYLYCNFAVTGCHACGQMNYRCTEYHSYGIQMSDLSKCRMRSVHEVDMRGQISII